MLNAVDPALGRGLDLGLDLTVIQRDRGGSGMIEVRDARLQIVHLDVRRHLAPGHLRKIKAS